MGAALLMGSLWLLAYAETTSYGDPSNQNNTDRMSPRDLFYRLQQESIDVDLAMKAEQQRQIAEQKKRIDRHHQIQRIGPDPKPENDRTLQIPRDPNPLRDPFKAGDAQKDPTTPQSPIDVAPGDKRSNNTLVGPSDEPAEHPNKDPNEPNSAIVMPENNENKQPNVLIAPEKQQQYLDDKSQPLKNDDERGPNPNTEKNDPLKTPE